MLVPEDRPVADGRPLTVADALRLPVLAAGEPRVVAGQARLGRPVRWVHITELTDPASFLKGGELVLTTGMPLPEEPARIRRYVGELADVGAAALVIELVRRYHRPPEALVRACRARGLPLVTLSRDVNFLEVTQVVHTLLLGHRTEALRRSRRIHEAFTALTLRGAGPEDVVRAAAELSGRTVVLEDPAHRALICVPSGGTVEEALTGWERDSRATPPGDRTAVRGPGNWLVAPVEFRGERWGRVVLLPAPGAAAFTAEHVTVLERTAMTLAVTRLAHPVPWERDAHRGVLRDITGRRHRSPGEIRVRAAALGLPVEGCRFVAVQVDPGGGAAARETAGPTAVAREDAGRAAEARLVEELATAGAPALVGEPAPGRVGVLLALRPGQPPWRATVERLARAALRLDPYTVVAVGSPVDDLAEAARSFREAARAAEAVPPGSGPPTADPDRSFHELADIGLRRLLYAMREDTRVRDYAERTLGRLADHDLRHRTELLPALRHYLDAGGNKTVAARRGGLSRQTLYQRLHAVERLLGCDLDSGEQRTGLHVALMAYDVLRPG
ncbi:PucR family transcriptional regulator [Streptomyces sp. NPDC059785]|uniref:PucR family transcriptional regulator n=1 Tax=Streptomyces sp. NPDC059785 TaxID=3346945 RepID=UPI003661945A